ncbi:MAG: hypothetical protein GY769_07565, partial [bacterium]|nr:hypothetical protein [bacterium]
SYLTDHLPLRRQAVAADSWIDLRLFGDSPDSEVHLGRGGWLFFDSDLRRPCIVDTPIPEILARLERLGATLRGAGRDFHFLIVPSKNAIYPEYTTQTIGRFGECALRKREELRGLLDADAVAGYLDLWSLLEDAKQREQRPLFFSNDSHINSYGASLVARELVDAARPGLWRTDALALAGVRKHTGDLTRLMGLPQVIEAERYEVRRPGVGLLKPEEIVLEGGPPIRRYFSES